MLVNTMTSPMISFVGRSKSGNRSLRQVLYLHGPGSNESMAQKQVQAVFKTPGGVST